MKSLRRTLEALIGAPCTWCRGLLWDTSEDYMEDAMAVGLKDQARTIEEWLLLILHSEWKLGESLPGMILRVILPSHPGLWPDGKRIPTESGNLEAKGQWQLSAEWSLRLTQREEWPERLSRWAVPDPGWPQRGKPGPEHKNTDSKVPVG